MDDLFDSLPGPGSSYTADDIEVLEGLDPVRRRPAMYIGGTDEHGLHHLFAEVLDNAMDEAVAGFANRIDVELAADGTCSVQDNGRGIPTDPHPKNRSLSALEVILTTLHSGGKFSGDVYTTSGGLHGVGISVVNALCDRLTVEVARERTLWRQSYRRGEPVTGLEEAGRVSSPFRSTRSVVSASRASITRLASERGSMAVSIRAASHTSGAQSLRRSSSRRHDVSKPLGSSANDDSAKADSRTSGVTGTTPARATYRSRSIGCTP